MEANDTDCPLPFNAGIPHVCFDSGAPRVDRMDDRPLPAGTPPGGTRPHAIEARGLGKTYAAGGGSPPVEALKSVDLTIPRGSFFGLLGPNGAGKSTFINVLAGLARKTSGTVSIWGYDIDAETRMARSSIGVVPQELNLDPFFTPFEAVEFQAGLYGVPKAEHRTQEILEAVRLGDQSHLLAPPVRRDAAQAVARQGVGARPADPGAGRAHRRRGRGVASSVVDVRALAKRAGGVTVLLTTHYLEEAEQLCDQIAIIHKGEVIACEPTRQLVRRLDRKDVTTTVPGLPAEVPLPLAKFEVEMRPPDQIRIRYAPSRTPMAEILNAVQQSGLRVQDLNTEETDLEEVFLSLTKAR